MANKEQHKDKKKPKQAKDKEASKAVAPSAAFTTPISAVKGGKHPKKK